MVESKVLKSNFRPVPLYRGILSQNKIKLFDFKDYQLRKDLGLEESIVENTLLMKKEEEEIMKSAMALYGIPKIF